LERTFLRFIIHLWVLKTLIFPATSIYHETDNTAVFDRKSGDVGPEISIQEISDPTRNAEISDLVVVVVVSVVETETKY